MGRRDVRWLTKYFVEQTNVLLLLLLLRLLYAEGREKTTNIVHVHVVYTNVQTHSNTYYVQDDYLAVVTASQYKAFNFDLEFDFSF